MKKFGYSPLCLIFLSAFVILWTQFGWFGLMPVSGDATRFGLGLMSEQSRAMSTHRIPLWNNLWGFGFPALAESQLGVFYPPHIILYGLLSLEAAYSFDIALHALWAGLGTWLITRRLGISAAGATLAGIVFTGSGFFLVHLPHHWGYATGSWLPWIFYAGFRLVQSSRENWKKSIRTSMLLAMTMAMPVLTGHFQLGFISMVSLGIWWFFLWHFSRGTGEIKASRFWLMAVLAPVLAVWLTLVQVWPTAQLAKLANQQRDWEYLSGFALPPTHLIGLLAPALGRTATFWRPLFWDQFHTSPEELFFYVGLVPLGLAMATAWVKFRHDRLIKSLVFTLIITLFLAFGPYFPGFDLLIRLPGFSFFRAPARWTLASTMILAILAGQGFDLLMADYQRIRRILLRLNLIWLVLLLASVFSIESVIELSRSTSKSKEIESDWSTFAIETLRQGFFPPWQDVKTLREWLANVNFDGYEKPYTRLDMRNLSQDRPRAWLLEAGPQALLLLLIVVGLFIRRRNFGLALISIIFMIDFALLWQLRPVETAPIQPVSRQSPLLRRLAELKGNNDWPMAVVGDVGNLPMAVGASPLRAYRTLDIPVMPALVTRIAQPFDSRTLELARLAGVGVYVIDPTTWAQIRGRWQPQNARIEEIDDPTLWAWLTTSAVANRSKNARFGLVILDNPVARAWRVPGTIQIKQAGFVENMVGVAQPLKVQRESPEKLNIRLKTDSAEYWVISQWADPSWQANLRNDEGKEARVEIIALDGGWQAIAIPGPGTWTLGLFYIPAMFGYLLVFSAAGWAIAISSLLLLSRKAKPINYLQK